MRQSPNTQLKTLVKALRLALYSTGYRPNASRTCWQVSAGMLLLGSSVWVGAETVPATSGVDTLPAMTSPLAANNNQLPNDLPSNNLPSNQQPPNSLQPSDNVTLASVDITDLMQQAQQAKQATASDAGRVTAPTASANVDADVIQSTNNELIVSSINSGLGGNDTPAPPVQDVDPINEMASAESELEQAREATQISADNADLAQGKKPDQIITENADALENPDKGEKEAREQKKPNIFKRVWYRFWPPKGELADALPTISARVEGAPKILEDNIEARLQQYTVEAFSDFRASLPQLRSMAREASEAVGYYQAEFRFEQVDSDTVSVLVTPNEPVIVQSQDIRYEGEATDDRTFQEIKEKPDLQVGDQMNDELYEKTKTRISTAGTEKGYFDGFWVMHDVKVTLPENKADINLDYDSGVRYKLGAVEFKNANPDEPIPLDDDILRQLVPFDENDEYGSWKVNALSRNLSDTRYFNNVQVDVITPDPIIRPVELPADADVNQLTTMQRQALAINNESDDPQSAEDTTNAPTVDESQFAGVADGDTPLERSAEAQQKLSEAEQKEQARKQAQNEIRETKVIPIVVTVTTDKPNSAELGVGYGTDTEFRLRSQYRKALINSRGHSVESNLELSKIRQAIDVRYNLPYKHPLEDTLSIFGGYEKEERKDAGRDLGLVINTATIGVERAIKPKQGEWQHTISARYRMDQLERNNNNINQAELPPPFNLQSSRFEQEALLFGYGLSKTYTVGRLDPTRALRQFYQLEVGSSSLLTDTDMAILRGGWHFIYSLGNNDNHQFVGRVDASTIITQNFEDVPYNLRFFAGGDQSIRGYDYKSLSTEKNGYLIGGQNLAVGSLEYNYQFIPKWRGAVFVDAGNAFDKNFNDPVKVGAGIGVRWSSPVGPIRVDVGAGVSEKNIPIRLHFFIGPQL